MRVHKISICAQEGKNAARSGPNRKVGDGRHYILRMSADLSPVTSERLRVGGVMLPSVSSCCGVMPEGVLAIGT